MCIRSLFFANELRTNQLNLKAMFTAGLAESDMEVVTLQGVEPEMIQRLIEYAYTGD
jgi:hypothetical protein